MTIRDFKPTIKQAYANATFAQADRFVIIGTDSHTYCEKTPTTSCWRVTPGGQIYAEEYLLLGEGQGLKLLTKTRDTETEKILELDAPK